MAVQATDRATATVQVHHRVPRCLLRLRDQADAHQDITPEALADWMDFEAEALEHGVDPDLSRDALAGLIEGSTVEMPTEEHRALHSGAGHFREWGRRGGVTTLSRYGRPWFALLAGRRWKKATAEDLAGYLTATVSEGGSA